MVDQPEDFLPTFKVLAIVPEYRTYTVVANSEDEARVAVVTHPYDFDYDRGDDCDDVDVIDIWEA